MSAVCPIPSCGGKAFNSERALLRHTQKEHAADKKITPPFPCQSFENSTHYCLGDLMTTTTTSFGNTRNSAFSSSTNSNMFSNSYCDSTNWECTKCNGYFENRTELNAHAEECLLSELLYQCDDCKQQFKYLSSLYDHVDETKCNHVKTFAKSLLVKDLPLTNGSIYEAILSFDGAAVPNPGNGGAGYVLHDSYGRTLEQHSINIMTTETTKHEAVYCSLIKGLQCASKHNIKALLVQGDSELVINQMTVQYSEPSDKLLSLNRVANRMGVGMFDILDYKWVPRRENVEADALARQGSLRRGDQEQLTLIS
jgi:ribonuclease HI